MTWLILIISLPGRSGTPRMRIWRSLKASGAGILRDGVYVLPAAGSHAELFEAQVNEVRGLGGTACLLQHKSDPDDDGEQFMGLFDRDDDYIEWDARVAAFRENLSATNEAGARRGYAQLRRELDNIQAVDFFPKAAQHDAEDSLQDLEEAINQQFSPGEPTAIDGEIHIRDIGEYQGRRWATRKNLWVDRVASAWLIRRFIDHQASFVWLDEPPAAPDGCVGFDFDGADFTHVQNWVTFEVLLRSFQLIEDRALVQIGELVHYLDVGGAAVPEAAGFVAMLSGAREHDPDDDGFLSRASDLLDILYLAYQKEPGQ